MEDPSVLLGLPDRDVEAAAKALLPKGATLHVQADESGEFWGVQVVGEDGAVIWRSGVPFQSRREALFEAYGSLLCRRHSPTPQWARPHNIALHHVGPSNPEPDPPDLDPESVDNEFHPRR